MREVLTTAGEVAGGVAVTYGCWSLEHWLGFVVGGVALAFFSWLVDR